jgi:single-strand selective monofunctional uracil DNA glycosylase
VASDPAIVRAAAELRDAIDKLRFAEPVTHVYNPLVYAWRPHREYLRRFGKGRKRVLMLGMNPGPYGMAQTGVPFGEVAAAREWMGIDCKVDKPAQEHPKRPIIGFSCERSEVSGRRLWGLFSERYPKAEDFFANNFVTNYCPLVFMEEGGRNRTPDKLPVAESGPMYELCDEHLRRVVALTKPEWLIGVGGFARGKLDKLFGDQGYQIGTVLHPSPASPAANRGWAEAAEKQLTDVMGW